MLVCHVVLHKVLKESKLVQMKLELLSLFCIDFMVLCELFCLDMHMPIESCNGQSLGVGVRVPDATLDVRKFFLA